MPDLHPLNSRQEDAMAAGGHVAVIAPPGSGKTKLLVTRLARDLSTQISAPRGAACITLTNAAATEMAQRFREISSDKRSNLFIGTVHGFALNRIVRPFSEVSGNPQLRDARVLKRHEADELWARALQESGIESDHLLQATVRKLRTELASQDRWNLTGVAVQAHNAYQQLMSDENVVDFSAIIEHAVRIVDAHADVRDALRAAFQGIYVDEYQDLAPGLHRIIYQLCFEEGSDCSQLFAVGDADQAIYGWTGTDSKLLIDLASRPDVQMVELLTNYRCGEVIAQVSRRLFDDSEGVTTTRTGGDVQALYIPGSLVDQFSAIVGRISELTAGGTNAEDIGVLCRTNSMAEEVAEALEGHQIPAWVRQDVDWESTLTDWFERALGAILNPGPGADIGSVIDELNHLAPGVDPDTKGKVLVELIGARPGDASREVLGRVLDAFDEAPEDARTAAADGLTALLASLRDEQLSLGTVEELAGRRLREGRVYVTTLPAGKGLQFDYVFIPDCNDGRIPFYRSFDDELQMAEERNKFYVGITRAREQVYLLWSPTTLNWDGQPRRSTVSRFVRQLGIPTPTS
ncbi:ATP-dependent helicase [Plantibacter sp. MMLR14_011]|uniref:ATP-dependent helicase n=1 Tax=Plantibacter sp. MMLR14_011 TaxID=1898746 RepID=UPI0009F57E9B|nr:ATP-dependent helicase [Plantibacter sp. MMLR14_011]